MTGDAVARVLARLPRARRNGRRWMAPCPAHEDRSPSLQVAPADDRVLLKCFAGCSAEAVVAALGLAVADLFDDAGEREAWRPSSTAMQKTGLLMPAPREPELMRRPVGAADLWARCSRVWGSPAACAWLRSRGSDPAAVEDGDLARVLPATGALPPWATFGRRTWRDTGHLLAVPMFDHLGELVTLHARHIGADPGELPKSLTPAGSSNRGAVMADALGRLLLAGEAREWPRLLVAVAEGVPDWLALCSHYSDADEDATAVLGIVAGSWTSDLAARIPAGAVVTLATDADPAGEKYAQRIAETLHGRELRRWTPPRAAA